MSTPLISSAPPVAAHTESVGAPKIRAVLVCDLVDSTALVERIGDSAAAALWRRHDRIARDLVHRHGGREIDKTDGFLILFERAIEAVAFALAYQRALKTLGEDCGEPLRARVGIHVGEVLMWPNSVHDIADGAKTHEVEGLAKPVAARLMALALPGQILMSGIAFGLAQRAAVELDTPTEARWVEHGRYRFKGLPTTTKVHEVGEPGLAPLTAPPSGPKAQRAIPWWRRPATLAVEAVAVLAAVGIGLALTMRAQPVIAFAERDWVVLGDVRNLTGESLLDDSLATAFQISMEQSRHVNVLPELKLQAALARMQRPPGTTLDREVASEIALREGARAVILPTVAEIGGRVRVSAELVDPRTQTTVYAESADGIGVDSTLNSIDLVTQQLRGRLGEALKAIERDSMPLPQVTSASLDALRAYALGEAAYAQSRLDEARTSYQHALHLDPQFALASIGLARIEVRTDHLEAGLKHAEQARSWQDRLTERDALYVDAWIASFGKPEPAAQKWRLMGSMYPDFHTAHYNEALAEHLMLNRQGECERIAAMADQPQYAYRGDAVYLRATCLTADNRLAEAVTEFARADELGVYGSGLFHTYALVAADRVPEALARLDAMDESLAPNADWDKALARALIALDQGQHDAARSHLDELAATTYGAGSRGTSVRDLANLSFSLLHGDQDAFRAILPLAMERATIDLQNDSDAERRRGLYSALALGYLAARGGFVAQAEALLDQTAGLAETSEFPLQQQLAKLVRAQVALSKGQHDEALRLLQQDAAEPLLLQWHVTRLATLKALGQTAEARRAADELSQARGQAFSESGISPGLRVQNIVDVSMALLTAAELAAAEGENPTVHARLRAFEARWTERQWPDSIRSRVGAIRPE